MVDQRHLAKGGVSVTIRRPFDFSSFWRAFYENLICWGLSYRLNFHPLTNQKKWLKARGGELGLIPDSFFGKCIQKQFFLYSFVLSSNHPSSFLKTRWKFDLKDMNFEVSKKNTQCGPTWKKKTLLLIWRHTQKKTKFHLNFQKRLNSITKSLFPSELRANHNFRVFLWIMFLRQFFLLEKLCFM